ncbi:hypothetical protein [Magnetofaba australis]|uniref:hypothetical protein n=1 Tax=Magnetofaba australis TaxID=1472297 RepID=UPI000A19EB00|nr:hypothetical protein [Magnetofaba australis]
MTGAGQIGFSQRIQLDWLEKTANLVLAGMDRKEITQQLQEHLQGELSVGGTAQRGNREKAISILLRIWLTGRPEWPFIREQGLELLRTTPARQHIAIHWGMSMAAYPFFGSVAEATGRLLHLQETVGSAQIQRRLRERFGERETVFRAARRILRVFADWNILEDTQTKGMYQLKGGKTPLQNDSIAAWLLTTRLALGDGQPESLRSLVNHPCFFPFQMRAPSIGELGSFDGMLISHHGIDNEAVLSLQSLNNHA